MAAIRLHARGAEVDDIQEIYRIAGMSRATFYRALRQYEEEGAVHIYESKKRGRPREYTRADIGMYGLSSIAIPLPSPPLKREGSAPIYNIINYSLWLRTTRIIDLFL